MAPLLLHVNVYRLNALLWYNAWPEQRTSLIWEKRFKWIGKWLLCQSGKGDAFETRLAIHCTSAQLEPACLLLRCTTALRRWEAKQGYTCSNAAKQRYIAVLAKAQATCCSHTLPLLIWLVAMFVTICCCCC